MADMEMRAVLAEQLKQMMQQDPKVVVIDADLAKQAELGDLERTFPTEPLT